MVGKTVYIKIRPIQYHGSNDVVLCDRRDRTLALARLSMARKVYEDQDKIIIHALINKKLRRAIARIKTGMTILGRTKSDVFETYPELDGTKVIGQDEQGNDVLAPIVENHVWNTQVVGTDYVEEETSWEEPQ